MLKLVLWLLVVTALSILVVRLSRSRRNSTRPTKGQASSKPKLDDRANVATEAEITAAIDVFLGARRDLARLIAERQEKLTARDGAAQRVTDLGPLIAEATTVARAAQNQLKALL